MDNIWNKKHFLGIKYLTREEIETVFSLADNFREISQRQVKKVPALRGKTVVNLFFENSTRTRTSFELAAKMLSADVVNFSSSTSSLAKGEGILDTIRTLEAYNPDILVIRDSSETLPLFLANFTDITIINAGDGACEHPTQALLDMFTVQQKKGDLQNLKVLVVGDIAHSRVARSAIFGFQKFECSISVCGPKTLIPKEAAALGVEVFYDFDKALEGKDVIIMLRLQQERQAMAYVPSLREYTEMFSLTPQRYQKLKAGCLVMHPGPVNWDVEIASSLQDKTHPLILEQVANGLAVRMAVLYLAGTNKRTL